MVVDRRERLAVEIRVADDDAVGRDERDARADQAAERIRLGIELGAGRGLPVRQRFGRQARLADERALDPRRSVARRTRPRHEHGGDEQRQRRRHERGQEETSAERHGRSISL